MCYFQGRSIVKVTSQHVPFIPPFQHIMNILLSPDVFLSMVQILHLFPHILSRINVPRVNHKIAKRGTITA